MGMLNDNETLKALRLAVVEVDGEGEALVSLALRLVLAEADYLKHDGSLPRVAIAEGEEREACAMAGVEHRGWPGWEVMFPYLDAAVEGRWAGPRARRG